ncbi:FMN-binding negative transcriptional regulator [Phenylobacterium montanum]|uniref:FMN-binding negative transcriptional regulator n=1 Tax=Phenylobacterium montanum TaxID=2823693 RepID=A0A975FXA8_9CAUL|nr:FMN-binding negative transcriptional regulator [Caulobacter sp. S6]QUD86856.1 FMN-binding negative transcriptional regulator [Caulobacter sp. S6]
MHPAKPFLETDPERLEALAAERGLALIVGVKDGRPLCAHAPVLLSDGRLRFHLSAANPLARALEDGAVALAVVTGAEAYVSPDWYGLEDQVPTWNYLSAEIEGPVRRLDAEDAAALLDDLSAVFEARLAPKPPWTRGKMTPGRFEAMLNGIVAFEMQVERLEGVRKLGQNKPAEARLGVASALEALGVAEMAGLVRQTLD